LATVSPNRGERSTPLVVGQLWGAPTASAGGEQRGPFMSTLLILISYEQKTQTPEMFNVVKTVLATAVWTVPGSTERRRFIL